MLSNNQSFIWFKDKNNLFDLDINTYSKYEDTGP
jgi:hypothetical protein